MDTNLLQTLRYKLPMRLQRINAAGYQIYRSILGQTLRSFLRDFGSKGLS